MANDVLTRVTGCPNCGVPFMGWSYDHTRPDPVEYAGGWLSPVLAGHTVIDYPMAELIAWVLKPCGCRVSPNEWTLCQTVSSAWFARPVAAEAEIRAVMAQEQGRRDE